MDRRACCTCALALLLLLAGCVAGIGGSGDEANDVRCHGLLVADEPVQEPDETVAVSNATVQSTEPIATVIERYRENGTRQRIAVDGVRANETRRALEGLHGRNHSLSAHVRLADGQNVLVALTANGTLCGGPP